MKLAQLVRPHILALLAGLTISFAWWYPGTQLSALLGWCGALAIVALIRHESVSYRSVVFLGMILNSLGFYWLFFTIKDFGGFDYFAASLIFLLFVVLSANQLLVFLFLFRTLPPALDGMLLRPAIAWVSAEYFSVRIFPWSLGHTQLGFSPLAQSADLIGTPLLAFLLIWVSDAVLGAPKKNFHLKFAAPLAILAACVVYGFNRIEHFSSPAVTVPISLIQANISIEEKHNVRSFVLNRDRYAELSESSLRTGDIIIWPESVITNFIDDRVTSASQDTLIPRVRSGAGMLVGAVTRRSQAQYYNSALAVLPDGVVLPPYHKRILMPFGEFTPFSEILPWLKDINSTAANFTPGKEIAVYEFPLANSEAKSVKLSPLICYEDIVPSLARDSTKAGADILVNLTNDAWFGDTVAPYQHHLIASFRAIENRRYLLRSTNSGFTAVVDPLGETVAQLPPFSDGVLNYEAGVIKETTYYTSLFGDCLWNALAIGSVLVCLFEALKRRRKDHVSPANKNV